MDKSVSFMRSLCMGEIVESLIYPFPKMKSEEQETLRALADSFGSWLKPRGGEFREWDRKGDMPDAFLQEMREFGLFSLIIPEEFGGLGFSSTAYSRTLQELAKYDTSVALTAGAHSSIGMRGLLLFGNDAQKQKYMPKLATGEMIAAFCLTEAGSGSDAASIKTKAVKDGDSWVINGEKIWITNGGFANFLTVFARTESEEGHITAFIVTSDMAGVSHGVHEDKMGIRASSTTSIILNNVRVPKENLLGEEGKGFKIAMKVLNSGRTGLGGGSLGMMKRAIELSSAQAKERKQFGKPIAEFGLIKQKIGHMVVDTYASEALVTLVAGIIDQGYEDYAVEAAISKVFVTEKCWHTVDEALQIAAGNGYMREFPYEQMLRDVRINRIFEGTSEILRLFIALTAMNDVGHQLKEVAKSIGGVMDDPIKGFGVLSDYARRRLSYATGIGQSTFRNMHPSVKNATQVFEGLVVDLASASDIILRKHGKDIINKQFATKRFADIMIDMFALAAVISRVSTSIQDKGENACKQEKQILEVFTGQVRRRCRGNFRKIEKNDDELIKSLAEHAYQNNGFIWDNL